MVGQDLMCVFCTDPINGEHSGLHFPHSWIWTVLNKTHSNKNFNKAHSTAALGGRIDLPTAISWIVRHHHGLRMTVLPTCSCAQVPERAFLLPVLPACAVLQVYGVREKTGSAHCPGPGTHCPHVPRNYWVWSRKNFCPAQQGSANRQNWVIPARVQSPGRAERVVSRCRPSCF